jgi:4-hydroxybenzoyl-CoA reductase subunit beta
MTAMPDFTYHRPATLAEAVRLREQLPESRLLAGGTDLVVNLRRNLGRPAALIDVSRIAELTAVREEADGLHIGAAVTLGQLAQHAAIGANFLALRKAALAVAGPTHREAATVGGNLCQDTRCVYYNQSEWWRSANDYCLKYKGDRCHVVPKSDRCYATYHGDLAPLLMVLGAEVAVAGPNGDRRLPVAALFREDGSAHLALSQGELVTAIVVPDATGWVADYAKARVRDAIDFPLAGVAIALRRDGDRIGGLRVAITGTNSAPLMVPADALVGSPWEGAIGGLLAAMRKTCNVLRTTVTSAKYRRRVLLASTERLAASLWQLAG